MATIKLQDENLQIWPNKTDKPPLTLALPSLRIVYLFFPKEFKWRLISPSETEYRYLDLDALSEEDLSALHNLLLQQQNLLGDNLLLIFKDYDAQSISISLKDFSQDDVDILAELKRYRNQRIEKLNSWLQQSPQITINNVTFDLTQAQQGTKKAIPWHALEKIEIREVKSVGTTNYFHFIPMKKGYKKFFQGVSPKKTEEFLSEIHFWRQRGTPPETVEMAQQRQVEAKQKSSQIMKWLLILLAGVIVLGVILVGIASILAG